jgi:hypothetical protein
MLAVVRRRAKTDRHRREGLRGLMTAGDNLVEVIADAVARAGPRESTPSMRFTKHNNLPVYLNAGCL